MKKKTPAKKGRGRPRGKGKNVRDRRVSVMFTEREFALLSRKAIRHELPVATLVHDIVVGT